MPRTTGRGGGVTLIIWGDLCYKLLLQPCFHSFESISIALLKAQVSLQLGKVFSSDNGVSVSMMYSYMY